MFRDPHHNGSRGNGHGDSGGSGSSSSTTGTDTGADADRTDASWPQRLERARQERNHREMARLLLDGAHAAMAESDAEGDTSDGERLERAQWLLTRAQRSLDACGQHADSLTLLCELLERQCRLSRCWAQLGHPGRHHVARELTRDLAFDVARRAERTHDLGLRVVVILRAAEVLDLLGDQSDALALRVRAFHRLGDREAAHAAVPSLDLATAPAWRSCQ
jgi:hypothetical protein